MRHRQLGPAMTATRDRNEELGGWVPPRRPDWAVQEGRYVRLERLDPSRHAAALHAANRESDAIWDYLPYGPFTDEAAYRAWAEDMAPREDPRFYTLVDLSTGRPGGVASYLRIDPNAGSIEVGHINFAPVLQRSRAATEAMYLMMRWAFEAGYRRYEWKCNAANAGSRRAAERLGLSYEGLFRQATVVKGRNRDTAWFAAIDKEWPVLDAAFRRWLAPENFARDGDQRESLADLTRPVLVTADPERAG